MKSIEIKNEISRLIKHIEHYRIVLSLEYGDGVYHEEGTVIANKILIYNDDIQNDYKIIDTIYYGISSDNDVFESEENVKILRNEQKKMAKYLKKHFTNIETREVTG